MNKYTVILITRIKNGLVAVVVASGIIIATPALAADVKGAKDHPVVSRYADSEIINYKQDTFNEYALFTEKARASGGADKNSASVTMLEGRVTPSPIAIHPSVRHWK